MKDSREEAPRARGSSNRISPSSDATGFFPARSTGEKVEMVNRVWGIWSRSDCPRQGSITHLLSLLENQHARDETLRAVDAFRILTRTYMHKSFPDRWPFAAAMPASARISRRKATAIACSVRSIQAQRTEAEHVSPTL